MSAERFDEPFWHWLGSAWAKLAPSVRIVAVFLLLGPVFFNLAFTMLPLTVAIVTLPGWRPMVNVAVVAVLGIPFAWFFGALPALATGFAVAVRHARSGRAGVVMAVGAGAVCTAAAGASVMLLARGSNVTAKDIGVLAYLVFNGSVASLGCWWVAIGRRKVGRREAAP